MKKVFMINKIKWIALVVILLVSGCDSILEIEPRQSIDADNALKTRAGVNGAINSVYARLRDLTLYGRDLIAFPEVLADNALATNNSGRLLGEYRNNIGAHFVFWQQAYFAINEANLIMDAIPTVTDSPAITDAEVNRWIGQLKFLRALYYFNLVRAYAYDPGVAVTSLDKGGVPLSTVGVRTVADALNYTLSRSSVADVYTQIYDDLTSAISLLSDTGTGAPAFASAGAAQALLSRVALYNKDYNTVVTQATNAIASPIGAMTSGTAHVNGWRSASHPESMFEVRFAVAAENLGVNVSLQSSFTSLQNLTSFTTGGWGDGVPTDVFMADLGISRSGTTVVPSNSDVRAELFKVGPGRGSGNKIECVKFIGKTGTLYMDNVPVIRKAELYLNRAEAYATPGSSQFDETLARADLNTILAARGLPTVDATLTGLPLYNEILRQRRLELAFEGHRFFDMKRLGLNLVKLPTDVPYTDFRILPPLPQRELDGNPNLVQNSGY